MSAAASVNVQPQDGEMRTQSVSWVVQTGVHALFPRAPFSFGHALGFLRRFPPTLGERAVIGEGVLGAARADGRTIAFHVEQSGSREQPSLRCNLHIPISPEREMGTEGEGLRAATDAALLARIADWLGIDDDLLPFYALTDDDPPFHAVVRRMYGYHQVRFFTPFENACWATLGQRTPISAARAAKRRLMEQLGGAVELHGHTLLAFPEPADLAASTSQELTGLVKSERKADRLLAIARAFTSLRPSELQALPTDRLNTWLRALPGIGPWSATFILLRGFGRVDPPLPLGTADSFNRELLHAGRVVYGPDLTAMQLAEIAERYGPWRGTWGHYLRVAL